MGRGIMDRLGLLVMVVPCRRLGISRTEHLRDLRCHRDIPITIIRNTLHHSHNNSHNNRHKRRYQIQSFPCCKYYQRNMMSGWRKTASNPLSRMKMQKSEIAPAAIAIALSSLPMKTMVVMLMVITCSRRMQRGRSRCK